MGRCALLLFWAVVLCGQTVQPSRPRSVQSGNTAAPDRPIAPTQRFQLGRAPRVNLGKIDPALRTQSSPRRGVVRVATHRSLSEENVAQGTWQTATDGTPVWRLAITSQNALGLRVHFTNFSVGNGKVWIHDTESPARQVFGPYSGTGRNGDGDFWSETVFSPTVEIEYEPAAGASSSGLPPFTISELVHIWQLGPYQAPPPESSNLPADDLSAFRAVPAVSPQQAASPDYSCFLDAACYQSASQDPPNTNTAVIDGSHSTALILFSDYQCSATILNAPNGQPLLLTAGHCINTQKDAQSMQAFFDLRSAQCGQSAGAMPTEQILAALPQALGVNLLAYSNKAFLDGTSQSQVQNDLDYSLIQLNGFPNAADLILAGYTANDIPIGADATSLGHPDGQYMQVAFGTRVTPDPGDYFANAFEIDQSSHGRVDSGSSGSGLFDDAGHLVGLLSTAESCPNPNPDGSCPTNFTSCDVAAPFYAWYTKFSAIYPFITQYLEQPLAGANLPVNPAVFFATPNPVSVTDGSGLGAVTLTMNDPAVSEVQIRVGAPNGPELYDGSGVGTASTGKWVTDGTIFFLQDVSKGKALTSANTIDTVTVKFSALSFTANPSSLPANTYAPTTLAWDTPNEAAVEIHVGSPSGPLFAAGSSSGTAKTGVWAAAGMQFYLIDAASKATISSLIIGTAPASVESGQASITATPNPIVVPNGDGVYGRTTLVWNTALPNQTLEVHVGSPTGPLFSRSGSTGTGITGLWVTNGLTFYLQNVTGGQNTTVATTTVEVTQQ